MLKQFFTPTFVSFEPKKSTSEIIEEIHYTFYTEVDKLLAEANISNSLETDKQALIDKCGRLKALGFTGTKEVKEAEAEISRLKQLEIENEKKQGLIEAINYFSFKYPHYKFITEQSVKRICEKYGLVYGAISKYVGTVPDRNLKHIEDFRVDEADECYYEETYTFSSWSRQRRTFGDIKFMTKNEYNIHLEFNREHFTFINDWRTVNEKCPLEIAAPLRDFNMQDHEIKDFKISKIEVPDPIVLKPVYFNREKHYLIVTAWGIEAEDADVLNQNHN